MPTVEALLTDVEQEFALGHRDGPERKLRTLIEAMGTRELAVWEVDLRRLFDRFQKKKRRSLNALLEERLASLRPRESGADTEVAEVRTSPSLQHLETALRNDLQELEEDHVFQWSTFYRDWLLEHFESFLRVAEPEAEEAAALFFREISSHSTQIFTKGYQYVSGQVGMFQQPAVTKSLAGLQRFLELPIEFYAAVASEVATTSEARCLRRITAAFLGGVLEGYGKTKFGKESGSQILPRFPRTWAHYLGFLTRREMQSLTASLEAGPFLDGVRRSVLPVVSAIDKLFARETLFVSLPILGQLSWEQRRLDIVLRPPPDSDDARPLELQCYLDEAFVHALSLQEASSRGVVMIAAPLKPDLQEYVQKSAQLATLLLRIEPATNPDALVELAFDAIDEAVYQRRSRLAAGAPLTYNCAREFPLRSPSRATYFHVHRDSVRDLLNVFERRNGVRLWCSVRRSGKTTACFDFGTSTGVSVIVSQTCDQTSQYSNADFLYQEIVGAIEAQQQLPRTFFAEGWCSVPLRRVRKVLAM